MIEYRIETSGNQFVVIDSFDEVVDTYTSEEAAKQAIEQCKKEDAMYETAKLLMESAVTAHMEQFKVSREIAGYWIRSAAEGA
jgi:diaminopimelate epimerase